MASVCRRSSARSRLQSRLHAGPRRFQSIGKSTAFEIIGGPWYANDIAALGTKDSKEQVTGAWIVELDELDAIRRASDVSGVKSFLSTRSERFRFSYGRSVQAYPRQCVFGDSTNSDEFLCDSTGNRRFWCVTCGSIDIEALRRDRDQLLAEAFYAKSILAESHYLDDESDIARAEAEAEKHFEIDPRPN